MAHIGWKDGKLNRTESWLDNNLTKKELKKYAKRKYDIDLSVNNFKKEMLDTFIAKRNEL